MMSDGLREPREVHTIEEYRDELVAARLAALDNTYYLYLCAAPTGSGKSTADDVVITHPKMVGKKSLTLAPDHQNCQEIAYRRRAAGIPSTPYPLHSETNCVRWDEAEAILRLGLSAVAALCPECGYREDCPYYQEYKEAEECDHKIATLARGRVSLPVLTKDCSLLTTHEDTLDLFAPVISLSEFPRRDGQRPNIDREHPLLVVARIADQAAEVAANPNDRSSYRHLGGVARCLDREHHAAFETVDVTPPAGFRHEPPELNGDLYRAACDLCLVHPPPREAMQLAVMAALGKLRRLVVTINEVRGDGGEVRHYRTLVGVGKTNLQPGMTSILNDATADEQEIRAVTERDVRVITPRGELPLVHPVVQICPQYDILRERNIDHAADILRGILHDMPQYQRVGLITHSTLHEKVRAALGEPYAGRITLESYFGEGLSRGSNEWLGRCDVIIVFGTPRPGTPSIRERLIQTTKVRASRLRDEQTDWHRETWTGTTESGETLTVETPRYRDDDWHRAYCNIAKAQLKQAIGRGRGILPEGIPVYVVTTEDIGSGSILTQTPGRYLLADAHRFAPLNLPCVDVLRVLKELEAFSGSRAVKRGQICRALFGTDNNKAVERTKYLLNLLLEAGRVRRKGTRKGWYLPQGNFLPSR
jgi:hypothetical protein